MVSLGKKKRTAVVKCHSEAVAEESHSYNLLKHRDSSLHYAPFRMTKVKKHKAEINAS